MPDPFRTSRLVEFHDTDMAGIMHFASFFVYMESAEHELLRSLGLSVHQAVGGEAVSFPRVSASCQYLAPARCEETLDIEVAVGRIGDKSVTYDIHFRRGDREIAVGQTTCVCCRVKPGGQLVSQSLPAEIVEKLTRFLK